MSVQANSALTARDDSSTSCIGRASRLHRPCVESYFGANQTMSDASDASFPLCESREYKLRRANVCIVGAGMTGICACKHLLQQGVEAVVLEAQPSLGGVWRHTYSSTRLQTPRDAFQFSDFPWPSGTPSFPAHFDVIRYFRSYASHFRVLERIIFNCKVVETKRLSSSAPHGTTYESNTDASSPVRRNWAVRVRRNTEEGSSDGSDWEEYDEWLYFEYMILCTGHYGDIPNIPQFPAGGGPEVFQGKVMHGMDYCKLRDDMARDIVRGKRVVVVGIRKSAVDLATEVANANEDLNGPKCTLLFQRPHWLLRGLKVWGIPLGYLFASRISQMVMLKQNKGFLFNLFIGAPMRWALSKFAESYLLLTQPLKKYGLVPSESILSEFNLCKFTLLPDGFFERLEEGFLDLKRTSTWSFTRNGVSLDNGTHIDADIVVLCTGYNGNKKLQSILGSDFAKLSQEQDTIIPLYRGAIPPHLPNVAILGFMESYCNLFTTEMTSRWLSHYLAGKIRLPTVQTMVKVTQQWMQATRTFMPSNSKACVNATTLWQNDEICQDICWNPLRKKSLLKELFCPYTNLDYKDT